MQARPVPRNIDRPNRTTEFVLIWHVVYYPTIFATDQVFMALALSAFACYLMYKYTMDKPEGMAMRIVYKYVQIGQMRPTPRRVKRFEI